MITEKSQLLLAYLDYYNLRRRDGSLAIDGIPGPSMSKAVSRFKADFGLPESASDAEVDKALKHSVAYGIDKEDPPTPPDVPEWEWKGKHFTKQEFACKCGKCGGFPVDVDDRLVELLDNIREHFDSATVITSGIRCKAHNAAVGGVSNSQHLYGKAADIVVSGHSPSEVARYADEVLGNSGGVGTYSGFTHVDVRDVKSRWWG